LPEPERTADDALIAAELVKDHWFDITAARRTSAMPRA
jgi:hypothetical protein